MPKRRGNIGGESRKRVAGDPNDVATLRDWPVLGNLRSQWFYRRLY
jgi:hypothetical protein